jgi:hypothetical protein
VALSARFGFDLDPAALTPAEVAVCRRATGIYREVRDLVQLGDLFRLITPDEPGGGGRAALGCCDPAGRRAVVFGYQVGDPAGDDGQAGDGTARHEGQASCPVPWARSDRSYQVRQLTLTSEDEVVSERGGADLMARGLPWPLSSPQTAAIWLVAAAAG